MSTSVDKESDHLRALLDHSLDAVLVVDLETWSVLQANNNARDLLERDDAYLTSLNLQDIVDQAGFSELLAVLRIPLHVRPPVPAVLPHALVTPPPLTPLAGAVPCLPITTPPRRLHEQVVSPTRSYFRVVRPLAELMNKPSSPLPPKARMRPINQLLQLLLEFFWRHHSPHCSNVHGQHIPRPATQCFIQHVSLHAGQYTAWAYLGSSSSTGSSWASREYVVQAQHLNCCDVAARYPGRSTVVP